MPRNSLFDYLSPIFYDMRELSAVFDSVQKQVSAFSEAAEKTLNNQFIQTADDDGINRLARSFKISFPSDMTLSEKRFELQARLAERRPYNEKSIRKMLTDLCGNDDYRLYIDRAMHSVSVKLGLSGEYLRSGVLNLLDRIVPSNMKIEAAVYNTYGILNTAKNTYGKLNAFTHEEIRTEETE